MYHIPQYKPQEGTHLIQGHESHGRQQCTEMVLTTYSVSSLVVPKMEDEFSGTDAEKNSK